LERARRIGRARGPFRVQEVPPDLVNPHIVVVVKPVVLQLAAGVYTREEELCAMALWLLKTEPDGYSWSDLEREKKTVWDGVTNALALKHVRTMKKGDLALIYHTGGERAAVGIAEIVSNPHPDPKQQDEKIVVVDVKAK